MMLGPRASQHHNPQSLVARSSCSFHLTSVRLPKSCLHLGWTNRLDSTNTIMLECTSKDGRVWTKQLNREPPALKKEETKSACPKSAVKRLQIQFSSLVP